MKPGDRVLINDRGHPWYGYSGILGQLLNQNNSSARGMYAVDLDNGMAAGCFLRQLEKVS